MKSFRSVILRSFFPITLVLAGFAVFGAIPWAAGYAMFSLIFFAAPLWIAIAFMGKRYTRDYASGRPEILLDSIIVSLALLMWSGMVLSRPFIADGADMPAQYYSAYSAIMENQSLLLVAGQASAIPSLMSFVGTAGLLVTLHYALNKINKRSQRMLKIVIITILVLLALIILPTLISLIPR